MSERQVAACRRCGAPIRWVKTRKKKNMPVDDEPVSDGRFVIDGELEDGTATVSYLSETAAQTYTGERYISHFKTCPNAE
jgi:hypothetical protein